MPTGGINGTQLPPSIAQVSRRSGCCPAMALRSWSGERSACDKTCIRVGVSCLAVHTRYTKIGPGRWRPKRKVLGRTCLWRTVSDSISGAENCTVTRRSSAHWPVMSEGSKHVCSINCCIRSWLDIFPPV